MPRTSTVERVFWEKRIADFRTSGLTAAAFAEKIGVNLHTLKKWKWKLDNESKATTKQRPARPRRAATATFVELTPAFTSLIEITIRDATIRVPVGFDDETLARTIVLLRGAGR